MTSVPARPAPRAAPCLRATAGDPPREVAQVVQRARGVELDLLGHLARFLRIAFRELLEEPELHGERDELLLGAVVDVALQPPALLVLRSDDPLPGRAQLLDQPHVPEHQARLRREIIHQPPLGRIHRIVRGHRDGQRPEELALVEDFDRGVGGRERRESFASKADRGRRVDFRGRDPRRPEFGAHVEPDHRLACTHRVDQDPRHPRQHILGGVGPGDASRELGEDLVRRRAPPVYDPVGDPPRQPDDRPEEEPDRDRAQDREGVGLDERLPHKDGEHEEDRDQHERHDRVQDGFLHDEVELVQAVAEDRDRARTREPDREDREEHEEDQVVERSRLVRPQPPTAHDRRDEQYGTQSHRRDEPAHLLTFLAEGAPETQDQRGDRGEAEREARTRRSSAAAAGSARALGCQWGSVGAARGVRRRSDPRSRSIRTGGTPPG